MVGTNDSLPLNAPCGDPGLLPCHVAFWIWKTVPFILLTLGTCGNILALVVLSRKALVQLSSTVYLLFLACSDLTQIWTALFSLSMQFAYQYDMFSLSDFHCMTLYWVIYTSGSYSIWILVCMTIERTLAITFPIQIKSRINRKTTTILCVVLFTIIAVGNGHYFYGQRLQTIAIDETNSTAVVCVATGDSYAKFDRDLWPYITFVLYSFVPLVVISVGNLTIYCTVRRQGKLRRTLSVGNNATTQKDNRATRLLLILSITFLVTTTPYFVFAITYYVMFPYLDDEGFAYFQLAYAVTEMFLLSNFTFNFYLYFFSGSAFQREFKKLIPNAVAKICCAGQSMTRHGDSMTQGTASTVTGSNMTLDSIQPVE